MAVARGMDLDERIGPRNLYPDAGYGGSCLPKDVSGLVSIAHKDAVEVPVIEAINQTNVHQQQRMIEKLRALLGTFAGKTICLLGLSFKPDTDDIREAPSLRMIAGLHAAGVRVQVYDPVAMDNARKLYPDLICAEDPYRAAQRADALVLMTEWNEFRNIDLPRIHAALKEAKLLDCRNVYEPREMQELDFEYVSVGRPPCRLGETPPDHPFDRGGLI